jgi:hypothetical protein
MLSELGMTSEEFQKGVDNFLSNREFEKLDTDTPLDNILKGGIPKGRLTVMMGKSDIGTLMHLYVEHLLNSK